MLFSDNHLPMENYLETVFGRSIKGRSKLVYFCRFDKHIFASKCKDLGAENSTVIHSVLKGPDRNMLREGQSHCAKNSEARLPCAGESCFFLLNAHYSSLILYLLYTLASYMK